MHVLLAYERVCVCVCVCVGGDTHGGSGRTDFWYVYVGTHFLRYTAELYQTGSSYPLVTFFGLLKKMSIRKFFLEGFGSRDAHIVIQCTCTRVYLTRTCVSQRKNGGEKETRKGKMLTFRWRQHF